MQHVMLVGRLGRDPKKVMTAGTGKEFYSLSLAVTTWRSGKEDTQWWNVTVWGDRFQGILSAAKKGSALIITGPLTLKNYEKDGETRYSLDVIAESIAFSPSNSTTSSNEEGPFQRSFTSSNSSKGTDSFGSSLLEKADEEDISFTPF